MRVTLLDVEDKGEGVVLEESVHHLVVEVAKDRLDDASDHAHSHFVFASLEVTEELAKGVGESVGVEEVVLNQVFGCFCFVEDVCEVVFVGEFECFPSADLQVIFAYFFANQPPKL